jgi:double-strand break repair protein AddB
MMQGAAPLPLPSQRGPDTLSCPDIRKDPDLFGPVPPDKPRVFAMPPGADFARLFAQGLLSRADGMAPQALARAEIIVNTRRMQRRISALLSESGARLLPRLRLVTDLGRELHVPGLPPPVPALRRKLELAQLVARLLDTAPDLAPRAAIHDLADSLARLMAEMQGENVPPAALETLDIADHARHWERSLAFIRLVAHWFGPTAPPDAEARQRAAVDHLIARWTATPPTHPVIVAGSTGSRGTTARLMEAVARLPQGALVLPGFDFDMPDHAWDSLHKALSAEDHPQYRFRRLLDALGAAPRDIRPWAEDAAPDPARNKVISLALRPAPVTDQWRHEGAALGDLSVATRNMTLIEAPSPRAEALAIALVMRDGAERRQRTALVTPDRTLARQVTAALDRWGIRPDDSAGRPLALSAPGRFLRHVAALFGRKLTAEALVTVLKHPLAHSGPGRNRHLLLTRALERNLRRHGPPFPDAQALHAWAAADRTEGAADWAAWLGPLIEGLADEAEIALQDHVQRHIALAEALAAGPEGAPAGALWEESAGQEAARLARELQAEAAHGGTMSPDDYAALFTSLTQTREVRDPVLTRPDIMIWGTLEARVQGADLVVLAGLNEGVWPETPAPDPWLNRTMRQQAGLLLPERQIGLAAHDFQQAACAPEVVLSRALRNAEAETVPARWVNRLTNLLGGLPDQGGKDALETMRDRGARWLAYAAAFDADVVPVPAAPRPAPRPPRAARPRELPVTAITKLIRDPYHVYARYVLRLFPLDPLHKTPDMLLRGSVLHKVVERFIRHGQGDRARLMALTDAVLAERVPWATARRLWRMRMDRIADTFLEWEARHPGTPELIEERGSVLLDRYGFTITAKPDRIDSLPDGRLHILDYKTGKPPNERQQRHFDKQLLLEAAMAEHGAFSRLGPREVAAITYVSLSPSDPDPVETRMTPGLTAEIWTEFETLVSAYMSPSQGFAARRAVYREDSIGDYDHLARFGEWQTSDRPSPIDVGDP